MGGIEEKIKEVIKAPIRKACDYICDYNRAMIMASSINRNFEKYRGINRGKNVYIIGGGPTVNDFKHEKSENDVYIGINRAFKDDRFELDYLFAQDQLPEGFDDFLNYRGDKCKKFLAIIPYNESFRIKEYRIKGNNYERYVLASRRMKEVPIDISIEPVADLRGTVFSVLQFAVYTDPDNIFLVGIDCSSGNVYNKNSDDYKYQFEGWEIMKKALVDMGAYDKVISINPVGLKGYFQDKYTNNDVINGK